LQGRNHRRSHEIFATSLCFNKDKPPIFIVNIEILQVCPLNVSDLRALDFVVNIFFIKLFTTNVMNITVEICQDYLDF